MNAASGRNSTIAALKTSIPVRMMRRGPPVMTWPRSWLTAVVTLVTRAAGGDPDAWAEIVELYTPLVWSICTRFKLSSAGTKNVAQMIWLLLAERLGKLRDPAALPGWLATTTRRECVRVINAAGESGQRQAKLDEALQFADDTAIDEEISLAERNAALLEAFAELPPHCQQLISMLLADPPNSYAEISATLHPGRQHRPTASSLPGTAAPVQRVRRLGPRSQALPPGRGAGA